MREPEIWSGSCGPIRATSAATRRWPSCTSTLTSWAAGEDAAGRYPGVAAHLAACGPCDVDFAGLLLAVTSG